jgi:hypothetical protein
MVVSLRVKYALQLCLRLRLWLQLYAGLPFPQPFKSVAAR